MTLLDRAIDLLCGAQSGFVSGSMPDVDWQNAKDKLLKDYRESRGVAQAAPSPNADAIVTALYQRFKDWSKRGFSADDVTWCEVRADVIALLSLAPAQARRGSMAAQWTYDPEAEAYYFALKQAAPPPYLTQRHVDAIIDIAADGTLAGVELIENMPPPPSPVPSTTRATPIMRAAENAAKVVDGWSDAKKDYAERVTASSVSSTNHSGET